MSTALHRQQSEKDKQNVDFVPPGKFSADAHARLSYPVYLASELSDENSKLCTNEKPSYLTNNTVSSGGPFSTFCWAAQHLLWAVFAAPVAWNQTSATATTI